MNEDQKLRLLESMVKELNRIVEDVKLKNASLGTMIRIAEEDLRHVAGLPPGARYQYQFSGRPRYSYEIWASPFFRPVSIL